MMFDEHKLYAIVKTKTERANKMFADNKIVDVTGTLLVPSLPICFRHIGYRSSKPFKKQDFVME